jgi:hypothetical protein
MAAPGAATAAAATAAAAAAAAPPPPPPPPPAADAASLAARWLSPAAPGFLAASRVRHADLAALRERWLRSGDAAAAAVVAQARKQGSRGRRRSLPDAALMYAKLPPAARTSPELALDFMRRHTVSHITPLASGGAQRPAANAMWERAAGNEARGARPMSWAAQQRLRARAALLENGRYASIVGGRAAVDVGASWGGAIAAALAALRAAAAAAGGGRSGVDAAADFAEEAVLGASAGAVSAFCLSAAGAANRTAPAALRAIAPPAVALLSLCAAVDAGRSGLVLFSALRERWRAGRGAAAGGG